MTKRQIALARAFPILIGIVVFGAIIVFLALRTIQGVEQSEEVAAQFEALAGVCGNLASNGRELARISPEANELRGVAFRLLEDEWVYDATSLPPERRAAQPEEANFVLCLGPSEPLVTTACGADDAGAAPTRIYGELLTARLFAAGSGDPIAEDTLRSAPDVGCRDEDGPVLRVGVEQVGDWLVRELEIGD